MNKKYMKETERKSKLLDAWNSFIESVKAEFNPDELEEIYDGETRAQAIRTNALDFRLGDGKIIKDFSISTDIQRLSRIGDEMFLAIGLCHGKWWPLDMYMISSIFEKNRLHISVNSKHKGLQEIIRSNSGLH